MSTLYLLAPKQLTLAPSRPGSPSVSHTFHLYAFAHHQTTCPACSLCFPPFATSCLVFRAQIQSYLGRKTFPRSHTHSEPRSPCGLYKGFPSGALDLSLPPDSPGQELCLDPLKAPTQELSQCSPHTAVKCALINEVGRDSPLAEPGLRVPLGFVASSAGRMGGTQKRPQPDLQHFSPAWQFSSIMQVTMHKPTRRRGHSPPRPAGSTETGRGRSVSATDSGCN